MQHVHVRPGLDRDGNRVVVASSTYWRTAEPEEIESGHDAAVATDVDADLDPDLDAGAESDLGSDETGTETDVDVDVETVPDVEDVTREEAEQVWAEETQRILVRVAGTYQALIGHGELAAEVQETTGIRTRVQPRTWINRVLALVAAGNHDRNEPALSALVVHKTDGMVGPSYDEVLRLAGAPIIEDPAEREKHAAGARLECYRWAGAKLPDDGGRPALSPRLDALQTRQRKQRKQNEVPNICPTCFMAIPPTGVCDNCG